MADMQWLVDECVEVEFEDTVLGTLLRNASVTYEYLGLLYGRTPFVATGEQIAKQFREIGDGFGMQRNEGTDRRIIVDGLLVMRAL